MGQIGCPETSVIAINLRCVTSQKSEVLIRRPAILDLPDTEQEQTDYSSVGRFHTAPTAKDQT